MDPNAPVTDRTRFDIIRHLVALWNRGVSELDILRAIQSDWGQPLLNEGASPMQLTTLLSSVNQLLSQQRDQVEGLAKDAAAQGIDLPTNRYGELMSIIHVHLRTDGNPLLPKEGATFGDYYTVGTDCHRTDGAAIVQGTLGDPQVFYDVMSHRGHPADGWRNILARFQADERPFTPYFSSLVSFLPERFVRASLETRVCQGVAPPPAPLVDRVRANLARFYHALNGYVLALDIYPNVLAATKPEAGGAVVKAGAQRDYSQYELPPGLKLGVSVSSLSDLTHVNAMRLALGAPVQKKVGTVMQGAAPPPTINMSAVPLQIEYPGMPVSAQMGYVPRARRRQLAVMGGGPGAPVSAEERMVPAPFSGGQAALATMGGDGGADVPYYGAPIGPPVAVRQGKGNKYGDVTAGLSPALQKRVNRLLGGKSSVRHSNRKVHACSSAWWHIMSRAKANGETALYAAMVAATQSVLGIAGGDVVAYCQTYGAPSAVPKDLSLFGLLGLGGATAAAPSAAAAPAATATVDVGAEYQALRKMVKDSSSQAELTDAAGKVLYYMYTDGGNVGMYASIDAEAPLATQYRKAKDKCPPGSSRGGHKYPRTKIGKRSFSRGQIYSKFTQPYVAADGATRCAPKTDAAEGTPAWWKAAFPYSVRSAVNKASGGSGRVGSGRSRSKSGRRRSKSKSKSRSRSRSRSRSKSRSPRRRRKSSTKGKKCVSWGRSASGKRRCKRYGK